MDTKLFINEIIRPLEKNLHLQIFLNNKENRCENNRNCPFVNKGEACGDCCSGCKFDDRGRFICIKTQDKVSDLLITLFHELGNATMHNIFNKYETNPIFCQVEAEKFAKIMCDKLNIPYNGYFRNESSINIIDYYWNLYSTYCNENNCRRMKIRDNLIDSITNQIIEYNLDYKKFL